MTFGSDLPKQDQICLDVSPFIRPLRLETLLGSALVG